MVKKYITKSERETIVLGKKIAAGLRGGEVLGLTGDLGSGKTVFTKGLAKGLGIKKNITSPTFVLMKVYKIQNSTFVPSSGRGKFKIQNFVHVDAYRLNNERDLLDIGLGEYLGDKNSVVVIEWADKVKKIFKGGRHLQIKIKSGKTNKREIIIWKKKK
ncbi:MAG: tRNA (adenosine(37)-N6)-threonylcarbamoyltransferase complex ATPase subunit type 1 TsaE [Patescibacteria group bacterium]|nr:tRNA (adenosine(37)-N6)-threonylcarbamoyltransferase complex ATPase subunit type 1 TsaE [Patescibacteria group bacterium]MDD5490872.1 tRNA (adenosine(37)-N6)-threonylcarbamoyltransferase complex ATPase subunit type 1 TsaE [Patescibacteria group bacterium]